MGDHDLGMEVEHDLLLNDLTWQGGERPRMGRARIVDHRIDSMGCAVSREHRDPVARGEVCGHDLDSCTVVSPELLREAVQRLTVAGRQDDRPSPAREVLGEGGTETPSGTRDQDDRRQG